MQETVIIRKQKLRIRSTDPEIASSLGKRIGENLGSVIIPALERAFNFIGPVEGVIEIDRINIDIGNLSAGNFEKQLPGMLAINLERELVKLLGHQYREILLTARDKRDFVNGAPSDEKGYDPKNGNRKNYHQKEYHYRAILHYLEKGIFPWDYERMAFKKDPTGILEGLGLDEVKRIIALHLGKKPVPVLRLFEHYPGERQKKLLEILISTVKNETVRDISRFVHGQKELLTRELPVDRKSFDRILVSFLVLNGTEAGTPDPVQLIEELLALFGKTGSGRGPANRLPEKALQLLAGKAKPLKGKPGLRDESTEQALKALSGKTRLIPAPGRASDKEEKGRIMLPEDVVYVNNAGIIILHPFLEALFRELGLLTDKHQFISGESRHKAAVILNYLFEKKDEYRDWEMTLNKILCSISPDDAFPADIRLTGAEKTECDNLLEVVAGHWTALKGSGAEAMQATFFRREGKLSAGENSWLLQIEHKTEDILIQKLPWGLGVVKFTWNDKPIFVQW
jgi:hypothetical protein